MNNISITLDHSTAAFIHHCLCEYQNMISQGYHTYNSLFYDSPESEIDATTNAIAAFTKNHFNDSTNPAASPISEALTSSSIPPQKMLSNFSDEPNALNIVPITMQIEKILQFAKTNDFFFEKTKRQLRSLWTTHCIYTDMDVDTKEYDDLLLSIWDAIPYSEKEQYSDFENYQIFNIFMSAELC